MEDIRETVRKKKLYVGFSGGEDSSLVAVLAKEALGKDKVVLVTIDWGMYTYEKSRYIVEEFAKRYGLKHVFVDGSGLQKGVWRYGPSCNACTKRVKIPLLKKVAKGGIVATGANSYDTWGRTGIKIKDGVYAPLHDLTKEEVRALLEYLKVKIVKIGESVEREGCKLKNLLKMLINEDYHGRAVAESNEVLIETLDEFGFKAERASVKIIGPLSKNVAVVVVNPVPPEEIVKTLMERISSLESVDDAVFLTKEAKVTLMASPPIYRNPDARRNIQKLVGIEGEYHWRESKNNRLRTFQVVGVDLNV